MEANKKSSTLDRRERRKDVGKTTKSLSTPSAPTGRSTTWNRGSKQPDGGSTTAVPRRRQNDSSREAFSPQVNVPVITPIH